MKGFTTIELLWIFGVLAIIFGFTTVSLGGIQQRSTMNTIIDKLRTDIKQQQLLSMIGDTQGLSQSAPYGIYFDLNRYVLFRGASYNPSDPSNIPVELSDNFEFTPAGRTLLFSVLSGQIPTSTSQAILDTTNNNTRTIYLNLLGVVIGVE